MDTNRQPGGDLVAAIAPGFTFGCEPLLICNDFNAQAFIGPDQWSPGSGMDPASRDIRLDDSSPDTSAAKPVLVIASDASGVTLSWPTSAPGFGLETIAVLGGSAAWTAVAQAPTIHNDRYQVVVQPEGVAAFYRLRQ